MVILQRDVLDWAALIYAPVRTTVHATQRQVTVRAHQDGRETHVSTGALWASMGIDVTPFVSVSMMGCVITSVANATARQDGWTIRVTQRVLTGCMGWAASHSVDAITMHHVIPPTASACVIQGFTVRTVSYHVPSASMGITV